MASRYIRRQIRMPCSALSFLRSALSISKRISINVYFGRGRATRGEDVEMAGATVAIEVGDDVAGAGATVAVVVVVDVAGAGATVAANVEVDGAGGRCRFFSEAAWLDL